MNVCVFLCSETPVAKESEYLSQLPRGDIVRKATAIHSTPISAQYTVESDGDARIAPANAPIYHPRGVSSSADLDSSEDTFQIRILDTNEVTDVPFIDSRLLTSSTADSGMVICVSALKMVGKSADYTAQHLSAKR